MENFIERLNAAIDTEYDWKNREIEETLSAPLTERIKRGDTIVDVYADFDTVFTVNNNNYFRRVKIKCPDNRSKFRETSPVILSGHGLKFKLEVLTDNDSEMELLVPFGDYYIPKNLNHTDGWQLDEATVDIRHIVKNASRILSEQPEKLALINGMLDGSLKPEFDEDLLSKGKQLAASTQMNPRQQEAFALAYSVKNFFLIQGPPGSGKTWLLAELALQFARDGKKVFITAPTHTAINNALLKCTQLAYYRDIIKIGKRNQREGLTSLTNRVLHFEDLRTTKYNNESKGIIVGASCYSPHTRKLEFMNWDVAIVDEAGQLGIPLALAGIVKADKFIFIGDHKQLPPIIADNHQDDLFKISIFEHLHKTTKGIMLDVTYRMNKWINAFPSAQFYEGRLQPAPEVENSLLQIPNRFEKFFDVLDAGKPEVLCCHSDESYESRSEYEAQLAACFVEQYLLNGVKPDDIAILTPFRAQVRQINKSLASIKDYKYFKDSIFIDTIERIQGQERDIVIFSLATGDPVKAMQRADFFFNPNRFNVAITRAKKKRIVIANRNIFQIHSNNTELDKKIKVFRDFFEASTVVEI